MHIMRLNKEPFELIKKGSKTIELRLYDEKRRKLKKGDIICFINRETNEEIYEEIIDLHIYDSFEKLYQNFDKTSLGYKPKEEKNPNDMEKYYSKEMQEQYGVVGIEIKQKVMEK